MEPDPKLLSLLEKVNNPIELFKIHITVKVKWTYNNYKRECMDLQKIGN